MRLTAVFDERQSVRARKAAQASEIGGVAIEVDRNDRLDARGHRRRAGLGVERQRPGLDVDDDRRGARGEDGEPGESRRERRHDHLVAAADAGRAKQKRDRVGAIRHADGKACAGRLREFCLEGLELGAEHVPAARQDAFDRGADVVGIVVQPEVDKRQRRVHSVLTGAESEVYCARCSR